MTSPLSARTPAIGFVVPAFNAEATVIQTLASLLRQTRRDWRAVVVDDGSTDATAARVATMRDPRIRLVRQANRGLAAARNTGWRTLREGAAPPYVCFLDADDAVTDRFCERTLAAIGGADAISGGYRMVDERMNDLAWSVRVTSRDVADHRLVEFNPLAIGAVLFRTSSLSGWSSHRGPFNERLRVHEDWDLFLRMAADGARWAEPVDADLMLYRQRPGSLTGAIEHMWRAGLAVIEASGVEPVAARVRAARRWTIRHVARACAAGDRELVASLLGHVRPLLPHDASCFIDAACWAILKHERIGPRDGAVRAGELAMRFAGTLPHADSIDHAEFAVRRALRALDVGLIARAAAGRVGPAQTLVLYGLGRQGAAILAALRSLSGCPKLAAIDDDAGALAESGLAGLRIADLTPRHIVLVTPGDPGAILSRLRGVPAGAVLTPPDLLDPPRAARAG